VTEEHFQNILDNNPTDWETRLIYSDWLEDADRSEDSQLQRIFGTLELSPVYNERGLWVSIAGPGKLHWCWASMLELPHGSYTLPVNSFGSSLLAEDSPSCIFSGDYFIYCKSRQDAEEAVRKLLLTMFR
jgi:uncharacterized protein (TIGR02996 family)